jgi:GH43 family beta-xylosidase
MLYDRTYTTNTNITMLRSSVLTDWDNAEVKLAFNPPPGMNYSTDLWAPELHQIDNSWYIIFTADPNADTPSPEVDMVRKARIQIVQTKSHQMAFRPPSVP